MQFQYQFIADFFEYQDSFNFSSGVILCCVYDTVDLVIVCHVVLQYRILKGILQLGRA